MERGQELERVRTEKRREAWNDRKRMESNGNTDEPKRNETEPQDE